jgi:hypothetical protein
MHTLGDLVGRPNDYLSGVDPLEMNLLVARGLPAFADLEIERYQRQADQWAEDLRQRLPGLEVGFHKRPQDWKNDIRFFRLGELCC